MAIHHSPLVCIFAHPDDEAFGPSGTIATLSTRRDVTILCATNGNAVIREKELSTSARILGVKNVIFLNFKDGNLNNNSYHDLARSIQTHLEAIKPSTLLTFDLNGISGHLDHIAVSLVTTYVFRRLDFIRELYYFCELESIVSTFRDSYFIYFPPGIRPEDADLAVDTRDVWDKKYAAMMAHESQRHDADMILNTISTLPKKEYFRILEKSNSNKA